MQSYPKVTPNEHRNRLGPDTLEWFWRPRRGSDTFKNVLEPPLFQDFHFLGPCNPLIYPSHAPIDTHKARQHQTLMRLSSEKTCQCQVLMRFSYPKRFPIDRESASYAKNDPKVPLKWLQIVFWVRFRKTHVFPIDLNDFLKCRALFKAILGALWGYLASICLKKARQPAGLTRFFQAKARQPKRLTRFLGPFSRNTRFPH